MEFARESGDFARESCDLTGENDGICYLGTAHPTNRLGGL